jgi:hypothetical protein
LIDFVKIQIPYYPREKLLNNRLLDFKSDYSLSTGELSEVKIMAEYKGMKFISHKSNKLTIQGSIHKYYNFLQNVKAPNQLTPDRIKKGFNGNTFHLTQLRLAIDSLCNKLEIKPNKAMLRGFEYGLNIIIDYECDTFLNALIRHKILGFSIAKDYCQFYRQVKHQRFIIKCYDKQIQYGLDKPMIRFENKQMKMIDINNLPIKTLADLKENKNLDSLKLLLLKKWDEVILYDFTINKELLSKSQKLKNKDLSNPYYWRSTKSNHIHRIKKRLKEYSKNYGLNVHQDFKNKMQNQWDFQNQKCVTFNRLFLNT